MPEFVEHDAVTGNKLKTKKHCFKSISDCRQNWKEKLIFNF